jgi:hypothetical protein
MRFSEALRRKHWPDESALMARLKALVLPWLVHLPGRRPIPPSWQRSFRLLRDYGLAPATVFVTRKQRSS